MRAIAVSMVFVCTACGGSTAEERVVPVRAEAPYPAPVPVPAPVPETLATAPDHAVDPFATALDWDPERERVREILSEACGSCHIAPISQDPIALRIFDLTEVDFAARMTDTALESMGTRSEGMDVSPAERDAVLVYFSNVLNERRSAVLDPSDC